MVVHLIRMKNFGNTAVYLQKHDPHCCLSLHVQIEREALNIVNYTYKTVIVSVHPKFDFSTLCT